MTVASQESGCDHIVLRIKVGNTAIFDDIISREIGSNYEFIGVDELIKAYMLQNNLPVFNGAAVYYPLDASGSQVDVYSKTLQVVYCDTLLRKPGTLSADVFTQLFFLTQNKVGWICTGEHYRLNYFVGTDTSYSIVYTKRDGSTSTTSGTAAASATGFQVNYVTDAVKAEVTMGDRSFTIFYIDMPADERYRFRNAFNALEYVTIPAAVNESPSTEFETAQIDDIMQQYDVEHKLDIEVKTAAIPSFMYNTLLNMCRSRYVERYDPYNSGSTKYETWSRVIIAEYKLDKSNNPNTPITLEMTLQFCDTKRNDAIVVG